MAANDRSIEARSALLAHLAKSQYSKPLNSLFDVNYFIEHCYPSLEVEMVHIAKEQEGDAGRWIIVLSGKYVTLVGSCLGPIRPARMVFHEGGRYSVEVLLTAVSTGSWKESVPPHKDICSQLDSFLAHSGYVICPGIVNYDSEFKEIIRFQSKNLRVWSHPVTGYDSATCLLWFKPSNVRITAASPLFNVCSNCKALHSQLGAIKHRALENSPGHKDKWTDPSSNRPLKYLSPASQAQRLTKGSDERRRMRKTILKYEDDPFDIELSDEQDEELQQLVTAIEEKGKDDLAAIVAESGEDVGDEVMRAWQKDVSSRHEFFKDQLKNRTSSSGNRWSMITFRLVLAIYTRSPSAYEALRGFGILQLPGISTLKSFTSFNIGNCGFNEEQMAYARQQYDKMVSEKKAAGERVPFYEGILVFDEVKVGLKVHYHAKTGKFVGLAMNSDELGSLHDVYQTLQPDHKVQKASYVLQYLWRCTSSDFDILGPYYTSAGGTKAKFILSTLHDAMHIFQLYGFTTKVIVCDGASNNLSAIKTLTGFGSGAYGNKPLASCDDIHQVKAWFTNPYTNEKVFVVICPSHQLKNMVSALYSSKMERTKRFTYDGVEFGWTCIEEMFARDLQRAKAGLPRRVPGLRESYVYRDIWTRLNVKPAKIMQQQYVLAELREYSDSKPVDAASVEKTLHFLQAVASLFEQGFLTHERITSTNSPILHGMQFGYTYFCTWLEHLLEQGLMPTNPYQKSFLAWQTWDLMRICWYGFHGFCQEFFELHPNHYILPLRANGSAIETVFSQLKHGSRGTLTAVSYGPARAQLVTKRAVHGPHVRDNYRNAPLYIQEGELPRLKRPRKKCVQEDNSEQSTHPTSNNSIRL